MKTLANAFEVWVQSHGTFCTKVAESSTKFAVRLRSHFKVFIAIIIIMLYINHLDFASVFNQSQHTLVM